MSNVLPAQEGPVDRTKTDDTQLFVLPISHPEPFAF